MSLLGKLAVRDSRSLKWRIFEAVSVRSRFIDSKHRRPCYQFTDEKNLILPAETSETALSEDRIHFSAGFLQYYGAFETIKPFIRFNPIPEDNSGFTRLRQPRSWVLLKPETSRFSLYKDAVDTYAVDEQSLGDFEANVLMTWANDQLRKLQMGSSLGSPPSNTVLGVLKGYLENPPPVEPIQAE